MLEHEWGQAIVEPSIVRYELVADGAATIPSFTHRGLSARNARGFIPGTRAYSGRLGAYLEGAPLPAWGERYGEVQARYE